MKKYLKWMMAAILVICGMTMVSCFTDTKKYSEVSATDDTSQFVTITDVVPDVILEIRYFGTYNFVGTRIDGYEEPTALLTRQAADSLKAVNDDVMKLGYRLKIYDAYRPQKGVDHFVRWAADINDTLMKPYFYPDLDKSVLFPQDYICLKSGHTRGSTLDLTLFDMATEKELDMGGTFDWFGPESHPDFCGDPETGQYTGDRSALPLGSSKNSKSPANPKRSITPEQFKNRMILRQAMLRHGFKPFDTEWWHFTLKDEPFPDTYFTFPVKQLATSLCNAKSYSLTEANSIIVILLIFVIALIVMGYYNIRKNRIISQRNEQLQRILTALDDYRAIVGDGALAQASDQGRTMSLDEQEEILNDKLSEVKKAIQKDNDHNFFVKMDARINKEKPFTDPDFDQDALVKFLGVSHETFCQLVPRYKDPDRTLEYINSLRAEYAAKLLMEHANTSAEEIVRWCGFKNVAAYRSAFRLSFGIIPTEYVRCINQMFKEKGSLH